MDKTYIAGHTGLAGSAIAREADRLGIDWIGKKSSELDLRDREKTFRFLEQERPNTIIVAAARVGGIGANSKFPVQFLSENIQIQSNVIDGAAKFDVEKLVFLGSSCIYPKISEQPIKENQLLTGPLEETNEPYSIAKIAGIKLVDSYRKQYGFEWFSVMPTNLYGPNDNFDLEKAHVLPALIRKFHEAKVNSSKTVEVWGSGTPRREFLHSEDLAKAIYFLLGIEGEKELVNVGTGSDLSIRELAELVSKTANFEGKIDWNKDRPDGTPRKLLDSSQIRDLGWSPEISLDEGIKSVYSWFVDNF